MDNSKYKWFIPSLPNLPTIETELADWDKKHENYAEQTFSITEDPQLCDRLIHPSAQVPAFDIPNSPDVKVLIPGCGSEIYLQKMLLERCPNVGQIYCTDFSSIAIQKAKEKWYQAHGDNLGQQVVFEVVDSTKITEQKADWQNQFDYVLVANSVVSGDDLTNRRMLHEFCQVLKPEGRLYGFFPCIYLFLECCYLDEAMATWLTNGAVNLPHSSLCCVPDKPQICYTPLRLNAILKEAGFKRLSFEIYMGDSDILMENCKDPNDPYYNDPDFFSWLFLVRYEKVEQDVK